MKPKIFDNKAHYIIIALAISLLGLLAPWWLYLIFRLSNQMDAISILHNDEFIAIEKTLYMIKWEGLSFGLALIVVISYFVFLFLRDRKRQQDLFSFYSGLTHELKTPLANIQLQTQLLKEYLDENKSDFLNQDSDLHQSLSITLSEIERLDDEINKHLNFSRLLRGQTLNVSPLHLLKNIEEEISSFTDLDLIIPDSQRKTMREIVILGHSYALKIFLHNVFQNTRTHTTSKTVSMELINNTKKYVTIQISDKSGPFKGDIKKLGKLHYKFASKGQGIGLFSSFMALRKMKAKIKLLNNPDFCIQVRFHKAQI